MMVKSERLGEDTQDSGKVLSAVSIQQNQKSESCDSLGQVSKHETNHNLEI